MSDQASFQRPKAILDNFAELYHVPFIHPIHRRMFECTSAPIELFEHGHTAVYVPGGVTDSGLARVQEGMASSGFQSVWLSDEECRVQHFHDALDARLAEHGCST